MDKSVGVIDRKFVFAATNPVTGRVVCEFDGMVFVATDKALPATLQFYREECISQGAAPEVIESLNGLYARVVSFQAANPDICKVADLSPEEVKAMGIQSPGPAPATTGAKAGSEPGPTDAQGQDEPAPVGDPGEGGLTPKSDPVGI